MQHRGPAPDFAALVCYYDDARSDSADVLDDAALAEATARELVARAGRCGRARHATVGGTLACDARSSTTRTPRLRRRERTGFVWPQALRRASQLLGGRLLSTLVRTLHHVKIVDRPGESLEAKGVPCGQPPLAHAQALGVRLIPYRWIIW